MVRIWRVPIHLLDNQRLNGEHHELHVIFSAIIKAKHGIKGGWQHHPQTLRFIDHLGMLVDRHRQQVQEAANRGWPSGFNHPSPLWVPETIFIELESYTYSKEDHQNDMDLLLSRQNTP